MQINQTYNDSGNLSLGTSMTQSSAIEAEETAKDSAVAEEDTQASPSVIVTLSSQTQLTASAPDTYDFGGGGVKKPPP